MIPFLAACLALAQTHHLWLEAESFGPLKGANFSFLPEAQQTRGSWALAGPDTAPGWTQGGESEFLSVAARADEATELVIGRDFEVPSAGEMTLWVRYADYRGKKEAFGVRILQGGKVVASRTFGLRAIVDELDPMKLYWDWAYAWDSAPVTLEKGPARIELVAAGPTEARRAVDCLCLTNDPNYRPTGREKPLFAAWAPLRERVAADPLARRTVSGTLPAAWKIADGPPRFLWNVGQPWLDGLKRPAAERVDAPFGVDPPLVKEFVDAFRGKQPPVYSHPLSGPVVHIPLYPGAFAAGSPIADWLARNPERSVAVLLNYGEPNWTPGSDRAALAASVKALGKRFVGYIAGENIAYAPVDTPAMEAALKGARSRREVLEVLRKFHTSATGKKFSDLAGRTLPDADAWAPVISCLSATNEAWVHALCDWGVKQIGHENTGNSPTLARRLAFLRGACRQFGAQLVDYQSCNLGDAATMFSREHYFYPGSSRYILDNSYDVWAGAGVSWLLKDYVLWHLAGVSAFYNEQGVDLFWKPGGNSAGDTAPVQLSPKGKVAEFALNLAGSRPRGVQFTPIAFLLDEAHGYTQERFQPGAFGLDPHLNPAALAPGRHEASIRGWMDIAYYPAPLTQGEPASAIRQTYVAGVFGDLFDVLVNAPGKTVILDTYPVVIVAGEVFVTQEWGRALREYVRRGGTLVVCADSLSGPGVGALNLPAWGETREASAFVWNGATLPSNAFRYRAMAAGKDATLATAPDGAPLAVSRDEGKGRIVAVAVPLGIGIDERPTPLLSVLMQRLVAGQSPVRVEGDVEWTLNKLDDGRWLVGLLNNRGSIKPIHGILPTDHREAQRVTVRLDGLKAAEEWVGGETISVQADGSATLTVPAGAVRLMVLTVK